MLGLIVAGLVVVWVGYMIVKKYYPQTILVVASMLLLLAALIINVKGGILPAKEATGSALLDLFHVFKVISSSRVAGLGLTIMSIAGFASYMDYVGASRALFGLVGAPLKKIKSPYVLLVLAFLVTQFLVLFIPSHAGLGLLLMVTMYPILIRSGVSKMSAVGVIACCQFIDIGPGSGNAILAATTSGLEPAVFFIKHQLPIYLPITIAVAIAHYFVQQWWDKKEGFVSGGENSESEANSETECPPLIYAVLPILPMIFILGFSPIFKSSIKMDVVTAMFLSTVISMVFEGIRTLNIKEVFGSLKYFYEGMGKNFASVISLIIAGEMFALGLLKIGAVDTLIQSAQNAGLGAKSMILVVCYVIALSAFLMGSGNAAFFS